MEKELLHKYFRGDASIQEEKQIMDWTESSADNYLQYLEERKIWNALIIHYTKPAEKIVRFPNQNKSFILWRGISIAASITLLFVISWTLFLKENQSDEKYQSVLVPAGQRTQIILEDGTKVWLNANSQLTYPTNFGKKERKVSLEGEGFFEVTQNKEKPFIVKTHKYEIKVLGTTFNVLSYNNDKAQKFETILLTGSVDIVSNENKKNRINLRKNERVNEVNGLLQKKNITDFNYIRWKEGLICLDNEPFDSLMIKFSLYYDISIKIENPKVYQYRCTGKFRQSDGIEYALQVIQKDLNFKYIRDIENNTITIM